MLPHVCGEVPVVKFQLYAPRLLSESDFLLRRVNTQSK